MGINRNLLSEEVLKNYCAVIEQIIDLACEDSDSEFGDLPRKRLEWLFGFGFMRSTEEAGNVIFGLESTVHNLKTEVYQMKSMVTYDSRNIACLLH
jgi:hypothetical protein